MSEQHNRKLYEQARTDLRYERFSNAIARLTAVIDDPTTSAELRELALYERAGGHRRSGGLLSAEADYSTLLCSPAINPKVHLCAVYDRGTTRIASGRFADAIADYTTVLSSEILTKAERAKTYVNRSAAYINDGQFEHALSDLRVLLGTPHQPADQIYKALLNQAECYMALRQYDDAISVLKRAHEMPREGLPATPDRNDILLFMAETFIEADHLSLALSAIDKMLLEPDAIGAQKARALACRARIRQNGGDIDGASADARSLLRMRVLPDGLAEFARKLLEEAEPEAN